MNPYNDNDLFRPFAKWSNDYERKGGSNCIIYTRVSTKEQEEGFSLITQKREIEETCKRNNLNILEYFGGVYESAKTDERTEFNRMLKFAKTSKQKVSYIMVYSVDRFSRSGANAIYIANELRKVNIKIYSVTQPADTYTATGRMQQNMQFIFSEYDNDLRKEKTVAGMKEMLMKGQWPCRAPLGYNQITDKKKKEQYITVNETGKLIRKAFYWKAEQNLSNVEIQRKLSNLGLKLCKQKITKILANSFYCGMMAHNLLEGEIVEGKHEKLVSKELFLKANNIKSRKSGARHSKDFSEVPLKNFVKCGDCGTSFIGYLVKAKNKWYYRCNRTGCKCNRNTEIMHKAFKKRLDHFYIDPKLIAPVKDEFKRFYLEAEKESFEVLENLEASLKEVSKKIEIVEERFTLGEIDRELYQKFIGKYREEKRQILEKMTEFDLKNLNLEKSVDIYCDILIKLPELWAFADYRGKNELQKLVFPSGISFDREKNDYRTTEIDEVILTMSQMAWDSGLKEKGDFDNFYQKSPFVPRAGLEPACQ